MGVDDSANGTLKRVSFSREFPPGCGISSSSSLQVSSRVRFVHNYVREFPPKCGPNAEKPAQIRPEKTFASVRNSGSSGKTIVINSPKLKSSEKLGFSSVKMKPPLGGKTMFINPSELKGKEKVGFSSMGTSKINPPLSVEKDDLKKVKGSKEVMISSGVERNKVLEMLRLFRKRCDEISRNGAGIKRVDQKADAELQKERKIVHRSAQVIGSIPGVEIGDEFYYRVELMIVGLHKLPQAGIDSMEFGGCRIATCIVANERHLDKMNDPNVLTYVGEGGTLKRNQVGVPPDQELKGGNLALRNSKERKKPVRVVRGLKFGVQKILYVYDGLYDVRECEKKTLPQGNAIFEFLLVRCPGQPLVSWRKYRWNR